MNKVRKSINFDGQIIYNETIFYYTFISKRKIIIDSNEPIKLGILSEVSEKVLKEIQTGVDTAQDVVFDFKTLV